MGIKKKIVAGALGLSLVTTSAGVYAGTIIGQYKTPRGNIATIEKEEVHKNRIAINVNGKSVKTDTWYANGVTYVPMRDVATMLGASVNYNSKTQSADIVTTSRVLELLGMKIGEKYYGYVEGRYRNSDISFTLTKFDPINGRFTATITDGKYNPQSVTGKLTTSQLVIDYVIFNGYSMSNQKWIYNGGTKRFETNHYTDAVGHIEIK